MNGEHSASPRREGRRKHGAPRDMQRLLRLGWIFLGLMLALSVAALLWLVLKKPAAETAAVSAPAAVTAVDPGPAGSAFSGPPTVSLPADEGQSGRRVEITDIDCDYTPPAETLIGQLTGLDLSDAAQKLCDNVRTAGWGECVWSVSDGTLVLRSKNPVTMAAGDFDKQAAFLTGNQPENLARTFLENSRLIPLLKDYGLNMSTVAENRGGEITFRGIGDVPGTECSAKFTFMYTGAFNQAMIRATYLANAVSTEELIELRKAAKKAVTWTPVGDSQTRASAVELRHIRGIPFYVFTCADGSEAYALAVKEDALAAVPGAEETYRRLMTSGIQDSLTVTGIE